MRVLTVTQPWASLIACGAKRIETRSWTQDYHRGPLAIRAAATFPKATPRAFCAELCATPEFRAALCCRSLDLLPLGAVVAVCRLERIVPTVPDELDAAAVMREVWFGDFSPGRFAWLLADVVEMREPIACDGGLGLRHASPELVKSIEELTR